MSYFQQRQAKRLESKGITTERGNCARPGCGHSWWDHSFSPIHNCQAWGCKCDAFTPMVEEEKK